MSPNLLKFLVKMMRECKISQQQVGLERLYPDDCAYIRTTYAEDQMPTVKILECPSRCKGNVFRD